MIAWIIVLERFINKYFIRKITMLQLRTLEGKLYIKDVEVEARPIYLGMSITVDLPEGYQGLPPLERVLTELFSDKYREGIDLFEANACRAFFIEKEEIEEINVLDGTVPAKNIKNFIFDFYQVKPKDPLGSPGQSN